MGGVIKSGRSGLGLLSKPDKIIHQLSWRKLLSMGFISIIFVRSTINLIATISQGLCKFKGEVGVSIR